MEIYFQDPDDIPLSREEVRIRELKATPYSDSRRVRVYLEITPFQEKPDADLMIQNADLETIASVSIIETIDPKMELTMHLPQAATKGKYRLIAEVFYRQDMESLDAPEENGGQTGEQPESPPERQLVDKAELSFRIPA